MANYPALRVAKGYLRKFPVTLRTEGDLSFLALDLKGSKVEPAPKRKQKDSTGSTTDTDKQATAGDENQTE